MKQFFISAGLILILVQPSMAQSDSTKNQRISGVERRLMELKKIITLSPAQEETLKTAFTVYQQRSDSIFLNVADPKQVAILDYQVDKQTREALTATLTDEQLIQYFSIRGIPGVMARTEAKIQLLRESGQYTEQELAQKQQEMFDYFMNQQVINQRDKYDFSKKMDDIQKLQTAQPTSLRESDSRKKLKATGRMNNGKIKW